MRFLRGMMGGVVFAICAKAQDGDMLTLRVPLDRLDAQSSAQTSICYKYFKPAKPGLPVIVFFTGGPGVAAASGAYEKTQLSDLGFSQDSGLLVVDARGTGCSRRPRSPVKDTFYSVENSAADAVDVIRKLNISNYLIVGQSYGTAVATVATHRLESGGWASPRYLMLQGVLSKAYDDPTASFVRHWEESKVKMDPETLRKISERSQLPFHASDTDWGSWIHDQLANSNPSELAKNLKQLSSLGEEIKGSGGGVSTREMRGPGFETLRRAFCSEMGNSMKVFNAQLKKGSLVFPESKPFSCGTGSPARPYDSAKFPVKATILYFQGNRDSNTPIEMARYHAARQPNAKKIFVEFEGLGHMPFMIASEGLLFVDCREKALQALVDQAEEGFLKELESCRNKNLIQVTRSQPDSAASTGH